MSYVTVVPEAVMAAASDLANLGSTISEANAAAAAPTTSVVAAAQDEVSTAIAALFGRHAQQFQALNAEAAAFHRQFVQALTGGVTSYVKAEAANVLGLMLGSHAGAFGAAAAAPAADSGIFTIFEKLAEFVGKTIGAQVDRQLWLKDVANGLANAERQTHQIITNGLQLGAKDGITVFTDGKNFVISGGAFAGLVRPEHFLERFENPRWLSDVYWKKNFPIDLNPQDLRRLVGSELHVFARGDGLAQSYLHKIGNEVYQVETDPQGQIISQLKVTSRNVFEDASLLRSIFDDRNRAVVDASNAYLKQAEQASRQLAEQAVKDAEAVVLEARQALGFNPIG